MCNLKGNYAMLDQLNLAQPEQLQALLNQAENELGQIQPRINELEDLAQELRELKLAKQRLLTLKMSLAALLDQGTIQNNALDYSRYTDDELAKLENKLLPFNELSALKIFHPDDALNEVQYILKQKQSLNVDMFKAVVFHGGKATTEEIKAFLVECGAKQPQTGESFENVPLTEISSRVNYLVRKGILHPADRGLFYTHLGWKDPV